MAHHNTVFSQILKLIPRHQFSTLAKKHDGSRRSDAMSRWTQFVAMATAQLTGRSSLRDIESTLASQKHLKYHLGSGDIRRTTLSRAEQTKPYPQAFLKNSLGRYMHAVKPLLKPTSFALRTNCFHWMRHC